MDSQSAFIASLDDVIARYYRTPGFRIRDMAAAMGLSERQLQRRLRACVGCSPSEYLCRYRLRAAAVYLDSTLPIGEIAHAVGFTSHAYFSSCFKAWRGTTPSAYRQRRWA